MAHVRTHFKKLIWGSQFSQRFILVTELAFIACWVPIQCLILKLSFIATIGSIQLPSQCEQDKAIELCPMCGKSTSMLGLWGTQIFDHTVHNFQIKLVGSKFNSLPNCDIYQQKELMQGCNRNILFGGAIQVAGNSPRKFQYNITFYEIHCVLKSSQKSELVHQFLSFAVVLGAWHNILKKLSCHDICSYAQGSLSLCSPWWPLCYM